MHESRFGNFHLNKPRVEVELLGHCADQLVDAPALQLPRRDVDGNRNYRHQVDGPLAQLCAHQAQYLFAQGIDESAPLREWNKLPWRYQPSLRVAPAR